MWNRCDSCYGGPRDGRSKLLCCVDGCLLSLSLCRMGFQDLLKVLSSNSTKHRGLIVVSAITIISVLRGKLLAVSQMWLVCDSKLWIAYINISLCAEWSHQGLPLRSDKSSSEHVTNQFTTFTNIQVIINQCDTIYTGRRWVKIRVISVCKKLNKVNLCNK
jgi:hypothetical protein